MKRIIFTLVFALITIVSYSQSAKTYINKLDSLHFKENISQDNAKFYLAPDYSYSVTVIYNNDILIAVGIKEYKEITLPIDAIKCYPDFFRYAKRSVTDNGSIMFYDEFNVMNYYHR